MIGSLDTNVVLRLLVDDPPELAAYFKAKNYTDKDIERYKRNLNRNRR